MARTRVKGNFKQLLRNGDWPYADLPVFAPPDMDPPGADSPALESFAGLHQRVRDQFGGSAQAYTASPGHADTAVLDRLMNLLQPAPGDRALDIATGAGHVALAMAERGAEVTALDLTPAMLEEAQSNAIRRGLPITTTEGAAECLPFTGNMFDLVSVRQAPHHFADVAAAVREMARVLRPGGRLLLVDSAGLEDRALDTQYDLIERLRDSTHVRSYTPSRWTAMLSSAGLLPRSVETSLYTEHGRPMEFYSWTARARTSSENVRRLQDLLLTASPQLRQALGIEIAPGFLGLCIPEVTILAEKSAARECDPGA